ncbi:MAG: hypothetical protein PUP93_31750 [Rhizonema sp. NSF051]|nr:hypothetical protein [Rhizonema sp. NSF051]
MIVPAAFCLKGFLNFTAIKQTFTEIIKCHEALRTTFMMIEEKLVQAIASISLRFLAILDKIE